MKSKTSNRNLKYGVSTFYCGKGEAEKEMQREKRAGKIKTMNGVGPPGDEGFESLTLDKVMKKLDLMGAKLDRVIEMGERILQRFPENTVKLKPRDTTTLLSLSDHLRKTMMVVLEVDEVTASEVARRTGRARAVESSYLNQMERMGLLKRRKRGRIVCFSAT